jgi:hypothetical protein
MAPKLDDPFIKENDAQRIAELWAQLQQGAKE